MTTESPELCAVCGTDCYCEDCDNEGVLPNDEARSERDPLYKPCPSCSTRHRFTEVSNDH